MDYELEIELRPFVDDLIKLGLREHYAKILETTPLFESPENYDALILSSMKHLRSRDYSDDARFVVCAEFDYFMRPIDELKKNALKKVVRRHWNELAEIYRQTPNFDFWRKFDAEQRHSQVKEKLAMILNREVENSNIPALLDLILDSENGTSREHLLGPLKRRKKTKWVQEFKKQIENDPEIGDVAKEYLS